jgi:uncharacterized protein (DUF885 family)
VTDPDPTRPGIFYIQLNGWASLSRGEAEITVVHEAWPGHALRKITRPGAATCESDVATR